MTSSRKILLVLYMALAGNAFVHAAQADKNKTSVPKADSVPVSAEESRKILHSLSGREAGLVEIQKLQIGHMNADCSEMQVRESFMTSLSRIEVGSPDPSVMISHNDSICLKGFNALSILQNPETKGFIFILSNVSSQSVLLTSMISEAARQVVDTVPEAQIKSVAKVEQKGRSPATEVEKRKKEIIAVPASCWLSKQDFEMYAELYLECAPKIGQGSVRWRVYDTGGVNFDKIQKRNPASKIEYVRGQAK